MGKRICLAQFAIKFSSCDFTNTIEQYKKSIKNIKLIFYITLRRDAGHCIIQTQHHRQQDLRKSDESWR